MPSSLDRSGDPIGKARLFRTHAVEGTKPR
jgi:hypothetical protein